MGLLPNGSVALIPTNPEVYMSHDIPFFYHHNTNFFYLCGYQEPGSLLVLKKFDDHNFSWTMFVRSRDPAKELWDGPRSGVEGAKEVFQPDKAYSINDIGKVLPELLQGASNIYFDHHVNPQITEAVVGMASNSSFISDNTSSILS